MCISFSTCSSSVADVWYSFWDNRSVRQFLYYLYWTPSHNFCISRSKQLTFISIMPQGYYPNNNRSMSTFLFWTSSHQINSLNVFKTQAKYISKLLYNICRYRRYDLFSRPKLHMLLSIFSDRHRRCVIQHPWITLGHLSGNLNNGGSSFLANCYYQILCFGS